MFACTVFINLIVSKTLKKKFSSLVYVSIKDFFFFLLITYIQRFTVNSNKVYFYEEMFRTK